MQKTSENLRATVAGGEAVAVRLSAEVLFEAGGKRLLNEATQTALRESVPIVADGALAIAAPRLLSDAARLAAAGAETTTSQIAIAAVPEVAKATTKEITKAAGKEILKGVARGAAIGGLVDAAFGTVEAVRAHNRGEMTTEQAWIHVGKEAATGAMATGAGVAVAAMLVVATGGLAAPIVFLVGAGTSVLAKLGLRELVR